ncbi:hypothetical protein SUDANB21_04394 [Streptomyces sp. enrichment culture]
MLDTKVGASRRCTAFVQDGGVIVLGVQGCRR